MIARIGRQDVESIRQIAAGRLPVARGTKHPMQDDQRRPAGTAEVAMEKHN